MSGLERVSAQMVLRRIADLRGTAPPEPARAGRRLARRLILRDALDGLARIWVVLARLLAPWLARAASVHLSPSRKPSHEEVDQ